MGIINIISQTQQVGTRKFYATIPDGHVQDSSYETTALIKNQHYFRIRLCEMFLRDKANYINGFIPMTVALNIFDYADGKREIPVFVGNQMLHEIHKYVKDQSIEFRNVPIIGPLPYSGADITLFIGLYRVAVDNLAQSLFEVVNTIIGAFGLSDFSTYLRIASRLGDGLAKLIGLPQVDMRCGAMDTFSDQGNTLRDRYLLFINSSESSIDANRLWVKDARLFEGNTLAGGTPFTRHDYCLVRIEKLDNRPDMETLPFHKIYLDSKTKVWEGNLTEAERLFLNLMRDLSRSPDLIPEDRIAMMKAYLANYQQEKENHATAIGILEKDGSPCRGERAGETPLSAIATIQTAASMAKNIIMKDKDSNDLEDARQSLQLLTKSWSEIPHLDKREAPADLTPAKIFDQFRAIKVIQRNTTASPEVLADVINFSAFIEHHREKNALQRSKPGST